MDRNYRVLLPLFISISLLMLGSGALTTLIGLSMAKAGFSARVAGLVMSSYYLGLVVGPFVIHRLISDVGHIRSFAALASLCSAAALAHPYFVDPWFWGALRFVQGFTIVGLYMCTESWLNEKTSNTVRGQVFAIYHTVVYLFQGGAQFMLNLPDSTGTGLFVLISVVMSLAVVPIAASKVDAPAMPQPVRLNMKKLYAISQTGMWGAFTAGIVLGGIYGLGPFFAKQIGLDVSATTRFMGAVIVGGLFLQWPLGKLSDVMDRRQVILMILLASGGISMMLVYYAANGGWMLYGLGALFGGVAFTLYPISVAYTNDYTDPDDLVAVSAGLLVAYGVGSTLGPLGASLSMEWLGAVGLFYYLTLAVLLTAGFTLWRMAQRDTVAVEDQGDFQPVPRTSPIASELDPRWEEDE